MPRSARDERIEDLGRALRRLRDLPRTVLATDDGVWPVTVDPDWIASARLAPQGSARVEEATLWRARGALRRVVWTRDAETVVGEGPLKGWRAADVRRVCAEAERAIERLEWAFSRSGPRPRGVLVDEAVPELRYESGVRLPRVRCDRLRSELVIADRLFDLAGPGVADRWLRSCVARTWPAPGILASVSRLRDDETLRVWALDHGVGEGIGAALRAPGADRAAVLETVVNRLWGFDNWREEVIAVLLADPEASYHLPARDTVLYRVSELLWRATPRWRARMRPYMQDWLADAPDFDPGLAQLPADLAIRAMRLGGYLPAGDWPPRRLRRYFDLLEAADEPTRPLLRQDWILDALSSRLGDGAFGLLAAAKRVSPGTEDAVAALLAVTRPGTGDVQRALAAWQRTRVGEEDERVAAATGLDAGLIARWRHHRRLLGEDEALPRRALKLAGLPAKLAAERDAIRALLATRAEDGDDAGTRHRAADEDPARSDESGGDDAAARRAGAAPGADEPGGAAAVSFAGRRLADMDGDAIVELERRLDRLEAPGAVAERVDAARKQVARSLERAVADARLRSLRLVLEEQARRRLPALGDGLPLVLLADLAGMRWLEPDDQRLLERLLDTVFSGGDLDAWPENRAWLTRQRFDAAAWRAGFDATVEGVRYCTETNPLQALHMGSWFGTCLRLDGGMFQFAAVNNTIEANRHVAYGYGPRGEVVARRLLAVTDDGTLLKYTTYAFADHEQHAAALDELCADLARRAGLRLGVDGQPSSLTGSAFYDDGVDAWDQPATLPVDTSVRGPELQKWPVADAVAVLRHRSRRPSPILFRALRWRGAEPAALLKVAEALGSPLLRWLAYTPEQLIERLPAPEAVLELVDRDLGAEAIVAALAEQPRDDVLELAAAALTGAAIRRIRPRGVHERLLRRAIGGTQAPVPALPGGVELDVAEIRRFDAAVVARDWGALSETEAFPDDPRFERVLLDGCAVGVAEAGRIARRLPDRRGDSLRSFAMVLLEP